MVTSICIGVKKYNSIMCSEIRELIYEYLININYYHNLLPLFFKIQFMHFDTVFITIGLDSW